MSNKIVSFEEFSNKAHKLMGEDTVLPADDAEEMGGSEEKHQGEQHYMFFQNIASIKHYIEEIEAFSPDAVDELLKNGHDWAADHIATSKDDIQEVAEWLRNEMAPKDDHEVEEPKDVVVDVEGNDDEVEIEDDGGSKEEEEDEDEE